MAQARFTHTEYEALLALRHSRVAAERRMQEREARERSAEIEAAIAERLQRYVAGTERQAQ